MILTKGRGSLAKRARRTGTHGSDPLDPDPAAEDVTAHVLILTAGNRSDGSGAMGRGAAAKLAGAELPRRRFTGVGPNRPLRDSNRPYFGSG